MNLTHVALLCAIAASAGWVFAGKGAPAAPIVAVVTPFAAESPSARGPRSQPQSAASPLAGGNPKARHHHRSRKRVRRHRGHARRPRHRKHAPRNRINLNTADAAALAELPGLGPGMAARIVAFRKETGPFDAVDDLADVAGMTERRIRAIPPYLRLR